MIDLTTISTQYFYSVPYSNETWKRLNTRVKTYFAHIDSQQILKKSFSRYEIQNVWPSGE
jgi:hypothetical protein